MEFHFDKDAIERMAADITKSVESTLNDAIHEAEGHSLDDAVTLVHERLAAVGVEPNDDVLRDRLTELGFV
jgi:hypothetical protein